MAFSSSVTANLSQSSDLESGTRLAALPKELLPPILRAAGRPARRVCRAFRAAYGPLDGGLCLDHFATQQELAALTTTSSPGAFRHIHTLFLDARSSPPLDPTLLTPLPTAFPALRSLHLCPPIDLTPLLVHLLAPIAPHLTALAASLPHTSSTAATTLATTLTSLRSLTLTLTDSRGGALQHFLPALHPLAPTLRRLTCHEPPRNNDGPILKANYDGATVLSLLAPFTRLTHLCLPDAILHTWDADAMADLAAIAPSLESFDVEHTLPRLEPHPAFPTTDDLFAALAAHTALTTLTLRSPRSTSANYVTLYDRLAPLPLAHLALFSAGGVEGSFAHLLEALAPASTLTHLHLGGRVKGVMCALPCLAPTLRRLTWDGTASSLAGLQPLSELRCLEALALNLDTGDGTPDPAFKAPAPVHAQAGADIAGRLVALTSLRVCLHVAPTASMAYWPLPLVRHVAARGALRHLELTHWVPEYAPLLEPLAACLVRLSVGVPTASAAVLLGSLGHLRALRCLHVRFRQDFDWPRPLRSMEAWEDMTRGWNMDPISFNWEAIRDAGLPRASADRGATWHVAASGGRSAHPDGGLLPQVALPPGLRQLCLVVPDLPPGLEGWRGLEAPQLAALREAAARQDCVVRVADLRRPLGSLVAPENDDCHGYRDGAAAEFVEARCREW